MIPKGLRGVAGVAIVAILIVLPIALAAQAKVDVTGTWVFEVNTDAGGLVVLWDPVSGEERWRVPMGEVADLLGPEADAWPSDAVWLPDGRAAFITATARGKLFARH